MNCPFCDPASDPTQRIVLESRHSWFLERPQPVLRGSGVIVPKRHCATVFELDPAEWADTRELLLRVKGRMDAAHHPDGYNVGYNCGAAAGQEIAHAHLHVIPRFADEPLAGRGLRYWIKQPENARP